MLNRASRTAEQVALFRALETARRRDRIFDDPLAVRFLPPGYRLLARVARLRPVGRRVESYIDERWAGPRASAVARTRLIDDLVGDAVAGGGRQVVLLGAGYDSRAYRLPALAGVPVFEVDHPATQAVKQRLLRSAVGAAGRPEAGEWHAAVRRQGEPWTFGFDPAALPAYLAERGLRLTSDRSTREAAERYLAPIGRPDAAAAFYRVAEAEVR